MVFWIRFFVGSVITLGFLLSNSVNVSAHPHVFLEANFEVFRDAKGRAVELRNVWRFDEIFSASVIVDFDQNGNNILETAELENIASTIKTSLKEFNYFTEVRVNEKIVEFENPKHFYADYQDGQLILIVAMDLKSPQAMTGNNFSISISDPTYYVAIEIADEKAIELSGGGGKCEVDIARPDFDALYSQTPEVFQKDFQGSNDPEIFKSDDYLTWVHFNCEQNS